VRAPDGGAEIEADIVINGVTLTFAQSMTVRVALGMFGITIAHGGPVYEQLGALGDNYRDRLDEVLTILLKGCR
jgi:hypothetical protein